MRIVFITTELCPFSRVGGLAEVSHDLPLALAEMGHQVAIITPKFRHRPELEDRLETLDTVLEVPVSWKRHQAQLQRYAMAPGVEVYFVAHEHLFDRDGVYGNAYGDYEDNAERFIFFSRACLELSLAMGWRVDVFHANDWPTALVPIYIRTLYAGYPGLSQAGTLMTVHNLGYQGIFWHYDMPLTGLGWEYFTPEAMEFYGKINFLKTGLVFADAISTVSPTYAREMLTPEMGFGLEGVIASRQKDLVAILNGVDPRVWSPENDHRLAANFSAENPEGKAACGRALRQELGLDADSGRPLVAVIGRLVDRKGLDLVCEALADIRDLGMDLAIMGFGEDHFHAKLREWHDANPGRCGLFIGYDMDLAHRMVAGADMLLVPSRFEPCGLHQMHAMRYGCVPVVRATGGLEDTVHEAAGDDPGNGFKFGPYEKPAMLETLARAADAFRDRGLWRSIMGRGMRQDFSWSSVAPLYEQTYRRIAGLRGGGEG